MRHRYKSLLYHTSQLLPFPHGMFCREGGVSTSPHDTLNLSYHVGDMDERVSANRALIADSLQLRRILSVKQMHSDQIYIVDPERVIEEEPGEFDAIISTRPGLGLLIQQADCQAVLLAQPEQGVIAAIHCGWRGSVSQIIGKTVRCMQREFNVNPRDLRAVISPSLGPCCAEFIHFRRELPPWMHAFQVRPNYFDFWAISRSQLLQAGLSADRIDAVNICTRCNRHFFSYRRAVKESNGITGRNGSVIGLPIL